MDPIEALSEEHNVIRKALENLSLATEMIENGEVVPVEFFKKWEEFYRKFILDFHHFKEEHVMFKELAQKRNGTLDGQIESLRYQHERGRNFINEVRRSLRGFEKGDEIDTTVLLENLAAYVSLLRHHINREEHIFYPMVEETFSEGEKQGLVEEFKKEDERIGLGNTEICVRLVQEMGRLLAT